MPSLQQPNQEWQPLCEVIRALRPPPPSLFATGIIGVALGFSSSSWIDAPVDEVTRASLRGSTDLSSLRAAHSCTAARRTTRRPWTLTIPPLRHGQLATHFLLLTLPDDLTQHVRSLQHHTMLHSAGVRSRLLLGSVPLGRSADEVLQGMCRTTAAAENRKRERRNARRNPRVQGDSARRTAAAGAFKEATTGLVSSVPHYEAEEPLP